MSDIVLIRMTQIGITQACATATWTWRFMVGRNAEPRMILPVRVRWFIGRARKDRTPRVTLPASTVRICTVRSAPDASRRARVLIDMSFAAWHYDSPSRVRTPVSDIETGAASEANQIFEGG